METVSARSFYHCGCPHDMRQFFYFQNKLRHHLSYTRVHAARIFCVTREGEMTSEIPEMLDAFGSKLNTFTLLEFYFSIFVVSCSSLGEVGQCCIQLCLAGLSLFIIHPTHYEKSDWSRAFNQSTTACELDKINEISAADIAFIMSSSTSAWLLSPLECSPQKQNG